MSGLHSIHRPAASRAFPLIFALLCTSAPLWTGCTQSQQDDPVVAMINGRAITQPEFDVRWNGLSPATRARYEKEGGKRRFLDELIMRELLIQEARKQGLDQSDEIREKTQRYKEQLILDEVLKDRIKARVDVSAEEMDAYLLKHADQLLANPKVHVSIMLLPNIYAAKDLKRQVESGGNFAKFAARYSTDEKSRVKGGDLGPYRKGLVEPDLDQIVQSLRPGVISEPVKTDRGYYLVKVSPLEPEILQADQATRERLRQELLAEKRRSRLDDMFSELKAGATIRLADAARYVTDETVQSRSTP
ncbi:MAG TPA: peptidylprolyl isomerase [Nitrospiraceae bacterium]|nr:peptidylprolyl isomerase [Nitrospiraceae bacterium]